jgi:hypothetical protein
MPVQPFVASIAALNPDWPPTVMRRGLVHVPVLPTHGRFLGLGKMCLAASVWCAWQLPRAGNGLGSSIEQPLANAREALLDRRQWLSRYCHQNVTFLCCPRA